MVHSNRATRLGKGGPPGAAGREESRTLSQMLGQNICRATALLLLRYIRIVGLSGDGIRSRNWISSAAGAMDSRKVGIETKDWRGFALGITIKQVQSTDGRYGIGAACDVKATWLSFLEKGGGGGGSQRERDQR